MSESAEYNSQTVAQLREELGQRGLTTTGKKAELVERLDQDDQDAAGDEALKSETAVKEEVEEAEEAMDMEENGVKEEVEKADSEVKEEAEAAEVKAEVKEEANESKEEANESKEEANESKEEANESKEEGAKEASGEGEEHMEEEAAGDAEEEEELLVKDECGPDDEEEEDEGSVKPNKTRSRDDDDEDKDLEGDADYKALRDLRKSWYSMIHPPFKVKVADDIKNYRNSQILHIWPLSVEESINPDIVAELEKCSHYQSNFSQNEGKMVGRLELVFNNPKDCAAAKENLKLEDINVSGHLSLSEYHEKIGEIGKKKESTTVAEHSKLLPWLLYVAPLPEGTTREDLVPIFPEAEEIMVFEKSTQKKGSETEEIPGFAYINYKDVKTSQKEYQEKYFDPSEPVKCKDQEVSILAIFDSKNEPWYFILKPSRRECHMKSLKEGREWLKGKKESDGPEVKRRIFRISQQIRYDYNRLLKDEKARKEFEMPLLEPKVEEVVPDITKETWRPQAHRSRERSHWAPRMPRGRGRGAPRARGGGPPRGGGYRSHERSSSGSRSNYSDSWEDRRGSSTWRGQSSGGRGARGGGYREPGAEHMLRRLSQVLERTLEEPRAYGSRGGYRGGSGGYRGGSGSSGGSSHYGSSHRGGGGAAPPPRHGGYEGYNSYEQRPMKRPRYDDHYDQGGYGGGGGRRW